MGGFFRWHGAQFDIKLGLIKYGSNDHEETGTKHTWSQTVLHHHGETGGFWVSGHVTEAAMWSLLCWLYLTGTETCSAHRLLGGGSGGSHLHIYIFFDPGPQTGQSSHNHICLFFKWLICNDLCSNVKTICGSWSLPLPLGSFCSYILVY